MEPSLWRTSIRTVCTHALAPEGFVERTSELLGNAVGRTQHYHHDRLQTLGLMCMETTYQQARLHPAVQELYRASHAVQELKQTWLFDS